MAWVEVEEPGAQELVSVAKSMELVAMEALALAPLEYPSELHLTY